MKSEGYFLVKNGDSSSSFELREFELKSPGTNDVVIEVEAFGLNFADVMARRGLYRDAPPKPCLIGYEVVGKVIEVGKDGNQDLLNKRVVAFTRFGGYAKHVVTWDYAAVPVGDQPAGELMALATQGVTAYYMSMYLTPIHKDDKVLVHAAAGGVGTLLVQLAKIKGATVYAKVGSKDKEKYVKDIGADLSINYRQVDYIEELKDHLKEETLDISFNPVAGSTFKKDFKLMGAGGRIVLFGGSELSSGKWGVFSALNFIRKMGLIIPVGLMMKSKNILGVNMLRIADEKHHVLQHCLEATVRLYSEGKIKPIVGKNYSNGNIVEAHKDMEGGQTTGKLIVTW